MLLKQYWNIDKLKTTAFLLSLGSGAQYRPPINQILDFRFHVHKNKLRQWGFGVDRVTWLQV